LVAVATAAPDKTAVAAVAAWAAGRDIENAEINVDWKVRQEVRRKQVTERRKAERPLASGATRAAEQAAISAISTFGVIGGNQVGNISDVFDIPDDVNEGNDVVEILDPEQIQHICVGPRAAVSAAATGHTAVTAVAAVAGSRGPADRHCDVQAEEGDGDIEFSCTGAIRIPA